MNITWFLHLCALHILTIKTRTNIKVKKKTLTQKNRIIYLSQYEPGYEENSNPEEDFWQKLIFFKLWSSWLLALWSCNTWSSFSEIKIWCKKPKWKCTNAKAEVKSTITKSKWLESIALWFWFSSLASWTWWNFCSINRSYKLINDNKFNWFNCLTLDLVAFHYFFHIMVSPCLYWLKPYILGITDVMALFLTIGSSMAFNKFKHNKTLNQI